MSEWRVTNGKQESLFIGSKKELGEYLDWFFNAWGGVVDVRPVTDLSVKEMLQTLSQRESSIVPNFWNVCLNCTKQFCTYHQATQCIRCSSSKLERRKYNPKKEKNEEVLPKLNGKVLIIKDQPIEIQEEIFKELRTCYDGKATVS